MIKNDNFKYYVEKENFLNDSEIDFIKDRIFSKSKNTINTNGSRAELVGLDSSEVRDYRKAIESEIDNNKITDKILSCVKVANTLHFKYDIDWDNYESFKLLKYDKGDGYGWHPDFGKGQESTRKLSVIVQLSDSEDYEGGDLVFTCGKTFHPSMGDIIIFPSNWMFYHEVQKITKGKRYSGTVWLYYGSSKRMPNAKSKDW